MHPAAFLEPDLIEIIFRIAVTDRLIMERRVKLSVRTSTRPNDPLSGDPNAGAAKTGAYVCREKRFLAVWFTKCP